MPICPECHFEYPVDVMVCPDCLLLLGDTPSARQSGAIIPDGSWVVVGSVAGKTRSDIAKGSLDSSNIPSVILIGDLKAVGSGMEKQASKLPGNIIMVPREFREEAETILIGALGNDLVQPSL